MHVSIHDMQRVEKNRRACVRAWRGGWLLAGPTSEPNPIGLELDAEAIVAAALDNRMDTAQLEFRLAVDELNIESARNRRLPDVTFDYTYAAVGQSGGLGGAFGDIAVDSLDDHAIGISMLIPLGKRTSTDVLLSASRLADAQSRRIRAFAEYEIAQVLLARATGTLLGRGQVQLNPPVLKDR